MRKVSSILLLITFLSSTCLAGTDEVCQNMLAVQAAGNGSFANLRSMIRQNMLNEAVSFIQGRMKHDDLSKDQLARWLAQIAASEPECSLICRQIAERVDSTVLDKYEEYNPVLEFDIDSFRRAADRIKNAENLTIARANFALGAFRQLRNNADAFAGLLADLDKMVGKNYFQEYAGQRKGLNNTLDLELLESHLPGPQKICSSVSNADSILFEAQKIVLRGNFWLDDPRLILFTPFHRVFSRLSSEVDQELLRQHEIQEHLLEMQRLHYLSIWLFDHFVLTVPFALILSDGIVSKDANINDILKDGREDACQIIMEEIGFLPATFSSEIEEDMPPIYTAIAMLLIAFSELYKNAMVMFFLNHETGHITTRVSVEDNEYIISIEDNGPGIPADELNKIFDIGYTARRGRVPSNKLGSLGLGLGKVRDMALFHGGTFELTSGPEGTICTMRLPITKFSASNATVVTEPRPLPETMAGAP